MLSLRCWRLAFYVCAESMVEKGGDGETCSSIDPDCMLTDDLIRLFLVVRTFWYG
jgi:hypothetical protein